jgi:hypothetical protein
MGSSHVGSAVASKFRQTAKCTPAGAFSGGLPKNRYAKIGLLLVALSGLVGVSRFRSLRLA